jgi:hypothetical protein
MKTPDVIEYVPARGSSGAVGRFIKLMLTVGAAMIAFAVHRAYGTDPYASDGAVFFGFFGVCIGGIGLLASLACWVRTGRFW